MLYAFLCYNDEATVCAWSKDGEAAVMAKLRAVTEKLTNERRLGRWHSCRPPPPPRCARTRTRHW